MALGRVREEVTRALDMLKGSWMDEMLGRDRSEFVQKRRLEQGCMATPEGLPSLRNGSTWPPCLPSLTCRIEPLDLLVT